MEIKRFFVTPSDIKDGEIQIKGEEYYHAAKVLRHKIGYKIIVCTGGHTDIYATVVEIGKDYLRAVIDKTEPNVTETEKRITLYQCIAKETDFIVQKAVELGVKRIIPVVSRFVNSDINTERLQKIVLESSKQCGRSALLKVSEPMPFARALEKACEEEQLIIFPYEHADTGNIRACVGDEEKIGIFIGSEGGFSEEEATALRNAGAKEVTLGKRILRAETAAVAALTLTLDAAGEMK